jgi:peptidyl-Lys metalloendopeptidase
MNALRKFGKFFSAALIIGLATSAGAQTPPPGPIEVTLQPRQSAFGASVPVELEFTIRNTSNDPVRVLTWRTPFGKILDNFLRVTRGSQDVPYIGPIAKRGTPTESDYIVLAPGATRTGVIDLSRYYAIFEAGPYAAAYDVDARGLATAILGPGSTPSIAASPGQPTRIRSNAAVFDVLVGRVPPARTLTLAATPSTSFSQCNAGQQTQIKAALVEAEKLAAMSLQAINTTAPAQQPTSQRYKTWFGAHTEVRWGRVKGHFEKIQDALANKAMAFHCRGLECEDSTFAYVLPTEPYMVYLCNQFWSAQLLGTDSRAGTIVHEASHFNIVAHTDDHTYGQRDAKNLAINSPERATANADSHEYFAENTPNIPM